MKATTLILLAVACVALVSGQGQPDPVMQTATTFAGTVGFVSSIMRGLIQGYKKGMYRDQNYKVTELCFGVETQNLVVTVFNDFSKENFDW